MLESLRKALISLLGGFPSVESAIERIKSTQDEKSKQRILSEAVKRLYNSIGAEDILHQEPDGVWMFRGRALTSTEMSELKQEAVILSKMHIWNVIRMDIRYQLGKKMFEEALVKEDIVWGQLLTFLDDIIRTRLKRMK